MHRIMHPNQSTQPHFSTLYLPVPLHLSCTHPITITLPYPLHPTTSLYPTPPTYSTTSLYPMPPCPTLCHPTPPPHPNPSHPTPPIPTHHLTLPQSTLSHTPSIPTPPPHPPYATPSHHSNPPPHPP